MLSDALAVVPNRRLSRSVDSKTRLTDALLQRASASFESFAALPSNVRAIEASLLFGSGLHPFVATIGPSGWGKSHLLRAACEVIERVNGQIVEVTSAMQWLSSQPRTDHSAPLVLDDVEDALSRPRARQQLRIAFERRVRSGRPTLASFTLPRTDRTLRTFLPFYREWQIAEVGEPSKSERELIIRQMASSIDLQVSSRIVHLIATKLPGNGRSILGCLQRLKLDQDRWSAPSDVARALGVLNPLLHDEFGWDGRDLVLECVRQAVSECEEIDPDAFLDVSAYVLSKSCSFGEKETGAILGLDPGSVYNRCCRVESWVGPKKALILGACERHIVNAVENC